LFSKRSLSSGALILRVEMVQNYTPFHTVHYVNAHHGNSFQKLIISTLYRVFHQLADLGWVDSNLGSLLSVQADVFLAEMSDQQGKIDPKSKST